MIRKKIIRPISFLAIFFLGLTLNNHTIADAYIGVDSAHYRYQVSFLNGDHNFDFTPKRLKVGYLGDNGYGVEFQVLTRGQDQISITDTFLLEAALDNSWGVSFIFDADQGKYGYHGSVGMLLLKTEYTAVNQNITDQDQSEFFGVSFGAYYKLTDSLKFTVDFNHYKGEAQYDSFFTSVDPTLPGFLDVTLSGFAAGVTYSY